MPATSGAELLAEIPANVSWKGPVMSPPPMDAVEPEIVEDGMTRNPLVQTPGLVMDTLKARLPTGHPAGLVGVYIATLGASTLLPDWGDR